MSNRKMLQKIQMIKMLQLLQDAVNRYKAVNGTDPADDDILVFSRAK